MSSKLYLEQYLDSLENLSPELTRNLKLMHELDQRVQDLFTEVEKLKNDYLNNIKNLDSDTRVQQLSLIEKKFEKCKELSDEKVLLANQTYEMVDKHIRRLDADLARFEAELKDRSFSDTENASPSEKGNLKGLSNTTNNNHETNSSNVSDLKGTKRKKKRKDSVALSDDNVIPAINSLALTLSQPADVLDMPVDPNEPTYCLCHQVSYGEMIGCDNSDCTIEWFHFSCVNLTSKPKGKWYCPLCTDEKKKKT